MRTLLAAATDWRSLVFLGAGVVAAAALSNPFPAVIGLGIYLWVVQKLAQSPEFQRAGELARTHRRLEELLHGVYDSSRDMTQKATGLFRFFSRIPPVFQRVPDVVNAAQSIHRAWLSRPEQERLDSAKMVEEALQLALHYMRILRAYKALYVDQKPIDLKAVGERLRRNQERLRQTQDLETRRTLMQAIEMDQQVMEQAEGDEAERERYQAKLAAIESALELLQRRMFQADAEGPGNRVHEMLLEAAAMDEALEEVQRRTRVRVR